MTTDYPSPRTHVVAPMTLSFGGPYEISFMEAALEWLTQQERLAKEEHPEFNDPVRDAAMANLREQWAAENRRVLDALNEAGPVEGDRVVFALVDQSSAS